jgi:phycoerythrin-associated linker protein
MALWAVETTPVERRPSATEAELQVVIRAVYKQVLGNDHLMESDRLTSAESLLRNGDITVRQFVESVAKSELYRSRFFESASQYRFIELNFKHLLGRAPVDQSEISEHVRIYSDQGYEAEINSYIDSEEYLQNFGENIVPYPRSVRTQVGIKNVGFNRMFSLMRGPASQR